MSATPQEPLAEIAADWSRPLGSDPRDPVPYGEGHHAVALGPKPTRPAAAPQVADDDTLIERKDLAPGSHTRVNAGDVIPAGLADLPRRSPRKASPAKD